MSRSLSLSLSVGVKLPALSKPELWLELQHKLEL